MVSTDMHTIWNFMNMLTWEKIKRPLVFNMYLKPFLGAFHLNNPQMPKKGSTPVIPKPFTVSEREDALVNHGSTYMLTLSQPNNESSESHAFSGLSFAVIEM